jgi:hypothetical protein
VPQVERNRRWRGAPHDLIGAMPNCCSTADLVGRSQVMAHQQDDRYLRTAVVRRVPQNDPDPASTPIGFGHRWRPDRALPRRVARCRRPLDDHNPRRSDVVEVERGRQGGRHAQADRRGRTPRAPVASARSNTTHARQPIVERQRSAAPPALEGRRQNFSPCLNALDSPCVRWPCRRWPNQCKPPASPPRSR